MATPTFALPGTADLYKRPQLPSALQGFGDALGGLSGYSGYQLSYQGGDKDRLMGNEAYQFQDFPEYMQQRAPIGGLRNFNQNIGQYFNAGPLEQSLQNLQQQQLGSAKASTGAAARAAASRAMQSGGRVGSSFAQGSAMLPLYQQQAQQTLDMNALKAQMQQAQAGLSANVLGQIAGLRQNRQNQRSNYAIAAAQLAQKRIGIGGEVGGSASGNGLYDNLLKRAQLGQMTPDIVKPGYLTNAAGVMPGSVNGNQMFNRIITGDLPNQRLY